MPTRAVKDHPNDDNALFTTFEWRGNVFTVKKKFPIFGFMRVLDKSPIEAMTMILSPESLELLETYEMDFADLGDFVNTVSKNLGAGNSGN